MAKRLLDVLTGAIDVRNGAWEAFVRLYCKIYDYNYEDRLGWGEPWSLAGEYEDAFDSSKVYTFKDWLDDWLDEQKDKGGYDLDSLYNAVTYIKTAEDYVRSTYPGSNYFIEEEREDGTFEIVEKDISSYESRLKKFGTITKTKEKMAEVLEDIIPFDEFKIINDSNKEIEIATFYLGNATELEKREKVRISLIVGRTTADNNWDMTVIVYEIPSDEYIADHEDDVCSMHLGTEQLKVNGKYEVCKGCEQYVEAIRNAINAISDSNYAGYAPAIARVVDSWFRDTYFVVPSSKDEAIKDVYGENPSRKSWKQNNYGDGADQIRLTSGNIEYVEVDNNYLEKTDEYWSKYEIDGAGNYLLYELKEDGTLDESIKYITIKSENGEILKYVSEDGSKELMPDDEKARRLVKKAVTTKINNAWSAYTVEWKTGESEYIPLQVKNDTNQYIKKVSNFVSETEYDEMMYYTTDGIPEITQQEDGRRGITNKIIKQMFKIRKYYIYDGTSERAEAIYNDWEYNVKQNYGTAAYNKYNLEIREKYDIDDSGSTDTVKAKIKEEVKELALELALDDFYYNNDKSLFSEDPRDSKLIGNITINKDTLNAFSILENVNTIDSDYQYRDFKELIVELNYFDKEDLSDKAEEVFTWLIPEYQGKWPIRMIDKSEDYYGTLIHSATSTVKLKEKNGVASADELGVSVVEGDAAGRKDLLAELADSTGYSGGLEVVSPVTGKIIKCETYERVNTDLIKYEGKTEDEALETVGYIQIQVLNANNIFNSTNLSGSGSTTVDGTPYTINYSDVWNNYYEEYEGVCAGYYVTIDGIDVSGIDLNNIQASEKISPVITPNLVDDTTEEYNQAIENIKVDKNNPAFVKIGGETYIREGAIIGKTVDGGDYSYTRIILRDYDKAVEENVESYFDLPKSMTANQIGVSADLLGIKDSSTDQEKVRAAVTYFKSKGFTTEAACGIVGNLITESNLEPDMGTNYMGLAQWDNCKYYMWPKITGWMTSKGYDNEFDFAGQITAIYECPDSYNEQMTGGKSNWEILKGLTDVEQAAEFFCVRYEKCPGTHGDSAPAKYYNKGTIYQALNSRYRYAQNAYKIYMGDDTVGIKD